jgi:NTP pyrophosphatase (non-canonical NTP hydrolase)
MNEVDRLTNLVVKFRDERDWKQFHNPKDLAISLLLEASEVLEHFQWKSQDDINVHLKSHKSAISDELADVLYWVLLMSHDLRIDLPKAFEAKLRQNAKKYPIRKVRGKSTKYTEL